jgi:outer membrane protein assembly factor BamB
MSSTITARLVLLGGLLAVGVDAQAPRAGSPGVSPEWPSFRGVRGSGVSATAHPPVSWNVTSSTNVAWRVPIAGLAHSSPIVSGNRVYLTTAIGRGARAESLTLGDSDAAGIDPADDATLHRWQLLALDRNTGQVIWTRTVHEGLPRVKRHVKGSHASATPATNGSVIVAMFGSEGLIAFDINGKELWRHDLGALAVGLADDPSYEWGPASSPIIHGNAVIVQNDRYRDSFLAAYDLQTGAELWRSRREERPSWATPLVHTSGGTDTIVVVSPLFVRGHHPATGRELWRLGDPDGQVKVSTPIAAGELAIVTGGWPPAARPIVALRARDGSIVWQHERGSPYTTTPLVYEDLLYVVTDNGILSAYQVSDGTRVYQTRLSEGGGAFSASPVAAAGRLYFTSEDGQVVVVRGGRRFEVLATNEMNEVCMATPALSGDMLLLRTKSHLYALRSSNRPVS